MGRTGSLYHEGTFLPASPSPAHELAEHLDRTLIRPEVLLSEKGISLDDCN